MVVKCSICGSCESWYLSSNKLEVEEQKYWNRIKEQKWYLCKSCGNAFPDPEASKEAIEFKWNNMRTEEDFLRKEWMHWINLQLKCLNTLNHTFSIAKTF